MTDQFMVETLSGEYSPLLLLRVLALDVARERGDECLLRDLDAADHLHPLLALLLLLEQLALAGDVAAVALGKHVFAHRRDRLASDDAGADGGLDRHLELLAWDELLEPLGHEQSIG